MTLRPVFHMMVTSLFPFAKVPDHPVKVVASPKILFEKGEKRPSGLFPWNIRKSVPLRTVSMLTRK